MLVLFETAAGYALFQVLNEGKLETPEELWQAFETPENAANTIKLKAFKKFENMASAVSSISDVLEGKLSDDLSNFLRETINETSIKKEKLIVADPKLGTNISKKLGIQVLSEKIVIDLYRGIRQHLDSLITGMNSEDISSMALGLSHSLSRHKLKFSPDKVDTMIIQAIGLLDDLDKELNTYAMRVKEWYGWHFPEMSKIVVDNLAYAKVVKAMGFRSNAHECDLSDILPEDLEKEVKEAAEISMGTEISDEDINNIIMGCDQVISLTAYRTELYDYLKSRMMAIAPNLTTIVGELVGARLISHAGSLLNLAKHPSSTVQILGAEKALFRALKTKNATPKYGLIYHASLVGQASPKNKGKVARVVASKSSLATRFDAIADEKDLMAEMGHNCRKMIETRLRILEKGGTGAKATDKFDKQKKQTKFELISTKPLYNPYADIANEPVEAGPSGTKAEESEDSDDSQMDVESEDSDNEPQSKSEGKKPVKKPEINVQPMQIDESTASEKKKEKKKKKSEKHVSDTEASSQGQVAMEIEQTEESVSSKKKEKKKKASEKQVSEIETTEESVSSKKKEKRKKASEKRAEVETHDITEESVSEKKKKKASEKQVEVETPNITEESVSEKKKKKASEKRVEVETPDISEEPVSEKKKKKKRAEVETPDIIEESVSEKKKKKASEKQAETETPGITEESVSEKKKKKASEKQAEAETPDITEESVSEKKKKKASEKQAEAETPDITEESVSEKKKKKASKKHASDVDISEESRDKPEKKKKRKTEAEEHEKKKHKEEKVKSSSKEKAEEESVEEQITSTASPEHSKAKSKKRRVTEIEDVTKEQSVEPPKPEKSKKLKVSKDKSVKVEEESKKKGKQKEEEPVKAESSKVVQKSKEKKEKKDKEEGKKVKDTEKKEKKDKKKEKKVKE